MDLTSASVLLGCTIAFSLVMMVLSAFIKAFMNIEKLNEEYAERGTELFKVVFIGQDLALMAFGLTLSSPFLRQINVMPVASNYGGNYQMFFGILLVLVLIALFVCVFIWHFTSKLNRKFEVLEIANENRWTIDWKNDRTKKAVKRLIIADVFGIFAIVGYAVFLMYGGLIK